MKLLFIFVILIGSITTSYAQEFGKNIGFASVTFGNMHPKEYVYTDNDVSISIDVVALPLVVFKVQNLGSRTISFLWTDSYFVISGESMPMTEIANGREIVFELKDVDIKTNDILWPTKIGNDSYTLLYATSKEELVFNPQKANDFFKSHGKLSNDRAVLTFEIDGRTVEKTIPIQVYTRKIKKALK